ncbi:hypothetical protein J2Z69_000947 [Paenibacillus shirakamiensis]|uniref:Uncharacterized protein n=1 Tax=Paenibacillus shirakamiensis TaxID=1265935 RepID=A0ABS4JDZ1_9BACL|nr:hypothetical protein [Paenibacillus shirakamiensis]MBP1999928.1 hypothetical protein [Paenibacillus shirakamiensis]
MKKNSVLVLLLLCFALFTIIPLTASAATNVQVTGQGQLRISADFSGSYADLVVTNQTGQAVYTRAFSSYGGSGKIIASIPNLPYGTYTISIGGPALSLSNFQYGF